MARWERCAGERRRREGFGRAEAWKLAADYIQPEKMGLGFEE